MLASLYQLLMPYSVVNKCCGYGTYEDNIKMTLIDNFAGGEIGRSVSLSCPVLRTDGDNLSALQ